ncbi:MAG: Osmosensitive K+ channel histidine kinase KdpD [uncultured Solirubrobacteraceae bacterium]|uniref:Osmosensitive K+ channel histidine kinase KdpD n=1 Tax=uncultured Solirubrobacteraceae bacterium TaxID=1162706 RepID=A0A6J4TSQ3_9ACTN|nr:MAG: Osmosensitive K+ channel histidine kinase KdpD [uncultured Solirubrobacteraceae bacterium]
MPGRYKIFLGMAAGAGKTYRMLQDGHAEADLGRDVAIGLVETHRRAATAALVEGLDIVPRRRVDYRGTILEEMDLPAVLARRPELCLIDELAHTNAPGVEHAKRYEDIADVLAADIDVFSTLNVQHLESLNDAVFELTGVRVRETVPDGVLSDADEVVLVDLTPETLVQRLREGKIYPPARVAAALNGFFKIENLQALREVALRQVAEDVEAKRLVVDDLDLREERLFGSAPAKPIAEHLLALAKLAPSSERVVRRAWRSSQRLGAALDILVVRDPRSEPSASEREQLENLRRIASALGALLLVEPGDDLVDAVVRVARQRGTTYILMGAPSGRAGFLGTRRPAAIRLMHALPGVDVRLVAQRSASG